MAENKILLQGPFVSMAAGLSRESQFGREKGSDMERQSSRCW